MLRTRTVPRETPQSNDPALVELQTSPFANQFAALVKSFYLGVYAPGRTQAILMALAQYPNAQRLYMIETQMIAQILGAIPGETAQNWSDIMMMSISGLIVPLPVCYGGKVVDPISRKCVAPQPDVTPPPTLPLEPTPHLPAPTASGLMDNKLFLFLAAGAVVFLLLGKRR